MDYLCGRVERVLYTSGTFYIFLLQVFEKKGKGKRRLVRNAKVSGHFFGLTRLIPGAVFEISGEWGRHQKYGLQFKAKSWRPWARNAGEVQFFLWNCVEVFDDWGVLRKITGHLGTKAYEALASDDRIEITSYSAVSHNEDVQDAWALATQKWRALRGVADLSDFLQGNGLSPSLVAEVFRWFGADSVKIISENPYRLMEVEGFSFSQADMLATAQGIQLGDPKRIKGGVLWAIQDQTQQGHLFVRRGDIASLMDHLAGRHGVAPFEADDLSQTVADALVELEKVGAVRVDSGVGVYMPDMYLYERESAAMLSRFLTPSELVIDLKAFLEAYESADDIVLSDMQREAIERLIANRVLVVSGAPGTGKTTLIRAFVRLFRRLKISHMLVAPTGIAAKRLATVTETNAQTVHRALRYDGFQWGHDRSDPLHTQAVICDEASMVGQELFYRLLDALNPETMLVLVGDDAQLPSVAPGNVLRELLACKALSHVRLEHVFRQAETSDIVLAAHRIRRGKTPLDLPEKEKTEFQFEPVPEEKLIAELIVQMAAKLKSRDENFQVLSPKYEGTVGVNNLNELLRNELNPDKGQPQWSLPEFQTRVGDRLMIIKNNYDLNVYNGDIGKLTAIKRDCLTLRVHGIGRTPDTNVDIPKEDAGLMLKLAYAVTVHRCQGEEFETIILPLVRAQGRMLQRNLFYTAVTRARKKVWLLGESDAILKAVANDKVVQRNTILRDLIVPAN
jgi:exodeoxyribonuclease V alpha subunit